MRQPIWWFIRPVFRISRLKTPLKDTDGTEKFKRMLSFLSEDKGRLFFTKLSFEEFKIHEIFITAHRTAWHVLKRNQAAKFLKNFLVHFVNKITFLNGNLFFVPREAPSREVYNLVAR